MPDLEYYRNLAAELKAAKTEESRDEAVGRKTISNLFFDENSMLEYLAEQRFPGDPTAPLRYSYVDGDLVYEDENGNLVPEFGALEDASMIEEYLIPNIVPATTLAADITGGIIGAGKGFAKGVQLAAKSPVKHPLAQAAIILGSTAAGGFGGNLVVGGLARTGRKALLDSFYNTPPEELAAAQKDLLVSSAFSAIPFGAGPATQIMNKFRGKEDSLQYLINLRKDMQGTIDEAARMGIELTPAEAAEFATRAVNLQFFLSRQPQLTAIKDFYQSRARRIADAVETYATKIGSQVPGRYGSANDQVKAAAQSAMKEINQKRKDRAARLYSSLEGEIEVDISPLVTRLDGIIGDLKQSQSLRAEAQRFKDSLFDEVGGEMIPVSDLMALHRRRVSDLELIVKDNLGNPNANTVIGLREDLTALMDAADASGTYNLARRVYDPTKASLQLIEQSAIGKIANMVTDKQTATAVKELFNPNVSIQSMRNAKRVLKASDPEAWKEAKKYIIQGKLDDFSRNTRELGLPGFTDYFSSKKNKEMMQELLEPEEYENFTQLIGLMDRALKSVARGGSDTQPLLATEKMLQGEVGDLGTAGVKLAIDTARLPGRLATGQVFDETIESIKMKQMESYYEALAAVMFDPNAADTIGDAYKYFNRIGYTAGQGVARGVEKSVDAVTEDSNRVYQPNEDDIKRIQEEIKALEGNQSPMPAGADAPIFNPLSSVRSGMSGMEIPGATVLPSEQDRELAVRLRQAKSGIGGLVV
jgi:hypothetical protein